MLKVPEPDDLANHYIPARFLSYFSPQCLGWCLP